MRYAFLIVYAVSKVPETMTDCGQVNTFGLRVYSVNFDGLADFQGDIIPFFRE